VSTRRRALQRRAARALAAFEIDLVALLGFLSPFEPRERFAGRVINVHPR
jgi:folate-dependent phosphoribosylglycinamide formyltransferase PurN